MGRELHYTYCALYKMNRWAIPYNAYGYSCITACVLLLTHESRRFPEIPGNRPDFQLQYEMGDFI